eukprot:TRINITY_DN4984_c0_g1_i2.p1 TRINITY_DN4984_c0_g1~~TRINITY_DN4984_c0_g1_i2.p1  ORF type:complete len:112 (-),score=7.59 TRINITY_DN4984_c0_g1_i2:307-642(-)
MQKNGMKELIMLADQHGNCFVNQVMIFSGAFISSMPNSIKIVTQIKHGQMQLSVIPMIHTNAPITERMNPRSIKGNPKRNPHGLMSVPMSGPQLKLSLYFNSQQLLLLPAS